VYLFIIDIAIQIGFNLDNVVIGAALGTSAVAVYAVTLRLADYQRQLCNQFNGLLFPIVVRLRAAGSEDALRAMLVEGTRIALVLVAGVTIGLVGFGRPLLLRWMGPGFEAGVVPLYVLAITGIVLVGQGPLGNILLGTGRHRLVAFVSLGEAVANLVLSVMLVRRLGMLGVAVGTAIPIALANLLVLLPAACRQVGVPVRTFIRLVVTAPAIGAVPAIVVCALLRSSYPPVSLPAILGEGVIVGGVYLSVVCAFGFDRDVRSRYAAYGRRVLAAVQYGRRPIAEAAS
jgi:O-antigen/teichoic acid export membrane protein